MKFRIDLHDPNTGAKTGKYPITTASQITRQRALDRIGRWSIPFAVSDAALPEVEGKDFKIYYTHNGAVHLLGSGSYLNHQINPGGRTVNLSAAGGLRDLQRQTVTQRSYDGATDTIEDVLGEIVPLRAGWAIGAMDVPAKPAPLDFWYETIFDSVAIIAATFGLHFREGTTPKTLDIGTFGADSGVMAINPRVADPDPFRNPNVCYITDLSIAYQSDQIVNRLIPFGGAVGVATIDLSETTETQTGYDVESAALPGGGNYYYIEDATSIATYGLTERRFLRKDLRPISNSPAAREFAANVIYEASLASLLNLKERQTVYDVSVSGLAPGRVNVGDKIRVVYKGVTETPQGEMVWLDLDDTFYVLEISETFGAGIQTNLKINRNAVHEQTVQDLLASTIKAFEQSQIHVQPTISRYTVGPYIKPATSTGTPIPANFSFKLGPETLNLWYARMTLTGEPFTTNAVTVESETIELDSTDSETINLNSTNTGGGSVQTSAGGGQIVNSPTTVETTTIEVEDTVPDDGGAIIPLGLILTGGVGARLGYDGGGGGDTLTVNTGSVPASSNHVHQFSINPHTHETDIPDHSHGVTMPAHSHGVTMPAHSHNTSFGVFEDSERPDSLTIRVNGSIVASGITLSAGNDYTYELDITSYILAAASLQQEHTIRVDAGSGQGNLQFQVQVLCTIQPILIS